MSDELASLTSPDDLDTSGDVSARLDRIEARQISMARQLNWLVENLQVVFASVGQLKADPRAMLAMVKGMRG